MEEERSELSPQAKEAKRILALWYMPEYYVGGYQLVGYVGIFFLAMAMLMLIGVVTSTASIFQWLGIGGGCTAISLGVRTYLHIKRKPEVRRLKELLRIPGVEEEAFPQEDETWRWVLHRALGEQVKRSELTPCPQPAGRGDEPVGIPAPEALAPP